ncbi:hypothetical protein NDS46_29020 [Paenibacillus thiaminolyticus]|uniref:hypothetical protein n=1 Tax=Paenibacillus thiaminolyticus TaxID=49283 RepID=UPI002330E6C7|nr:hypothetical protein [Paenibacillus thiaminolyticus]WCF08248.1 hypothetical protein NDS46_29020 [Paenibacillus thiaminolyticus]
MKKTWCLTVALFFGAVLIAAACARKDGNLLQSPGQGEANAPSRLESQPANPPRMTESVIYELDLAKYSAIPEIPFYADGEMTVIGTDTLKALEGGHHPWLNHAETIVATKLNNLVPPEEKGADGLYDHLVEKVSQESPDRATYRIRLSERFYYDIHLDTFTDQEDHAVMFITKITLHYAD